MQVPTSYRILLLSLLMVPGITFNIGASSGSSALVSRSPLAVIKTENSHLCLSMANQCQGSIVAGLHQQPAMQTRRSMLQKSTGSVKANSKTPVMTCKPNSETSYQYTAAINSELSNTNSQVDAARSNALNNGESYQAFDAQVNTLFAAYDVAVQQDYNTYLSVLNGCPPTQAAPQLFQMFVP